MREAEMFVGVILLCGLGLAGTVHAQTLESGELSAQEAYKRGIEHYDDGDYERAAEFFRYAVDKKSHPVLHFNLSQSYAKLGKWERAFEQAELAETTGELDEKTSAKNRATIAAGGVVTGARDSAGRIQAAGEAPVDGRPQASTDRPTSDGGEKTASSLLSPLGWGGVGGAVAGLGMITGAVLVDGSLGSDFEARRTAHEKGNTQRAEELTSTIRSKQTTGKILLYGGSGLAVVGAGLLIADLTMNSGGAETREVRLFVAPRARAWSAGVVMPF